MKRYNLVIVYYDGTSRSASIDKESKLEAIHYVLETERYPEDIVTITAIEYVRKDI